MEEDLVKILEDNLQFRAEKPAMFYGENFDTYGEVYRRASSIAGALLERGLEPGQRIGIHLANIPEFVYTYFGTLMAGCQVIPINVMLKPGELAFLARDSDIRFVVTQPPFAENVVLAREQAPSIKEVFCIHEPTPGTTPFDELLGRPVATRPKVRGPDRVAVIFYTSGTTGKPKGAMLTHKNLYTNALATAKAYEYVEKDVILFGMPLFHASGLTNVLNASFSQGASVVMMPRFSVEDAFAAVKRHPVTVFIGVPTMYHQILKHPHWGILKKDSLRVFIVGAAPMPKALFEDVSKRYNLPITEGYGLTETSPVVAHNPLDGVKKIGSVGLPVSGVSVRVVDPEDNDLPAGQVGELLVKGPNVMAGYLNQPEETQATLRGGWLHTSDLARIDEDGYIFIVDRIKDIILTGGANIYPREIEEVLHTHPAVNEAAVIGVPDEEKGELATAFIIPKKGQTVSERDIISFCKDRMAVYKAPRKVFFVEELPRNPSGKVLKRLLRDQLLKSDTPR
jgi:long-chain acyl-CoA synthetase